MRWAHVFALMVLAVWGCGCSTFDYEWRRAGRTPVPANEITGRWEGKWLSESTGHEGKLRCLLTKREDGDFDARFRATYKRFLRFGYTVPLKAHGSTNGLHVAGSADLGRLWGTYTCEGEVNPTNFFARYRSKYDRGTFEMRRPR